MIDVACTLYMRRSVERFGMAPLTSMLWYSEGMSRFLASDWRPEVHDSDGLLMQTGAGEFIWRPLNNPPRLSVSAFADRSPKGFGLLQRDRAFDYYIDDGFEENRPDIWVEPEGDWGQGSVQLVEIPTHQETDDNIVALWVPDDPPQAGIRSQLRLPAALDRRGARRHGSRPLRRHAGHEGRMAPGRGSTPGPRQPGAAVRAGIRGAALVGLDPEKTSVALTLSRGSAEEVGATWAPYGKPSPWRVFFKVYAEGPEPFEMRLQLKSGDRLLLRDLGLPILSGSTRHGAVTSDRADARIAPAATGACSARAPAADPQPQPRPS